MPDTKEEDLPVVGVNEASGSGGKIGGKGLVKPHVDYMASTGTRFEVAKFDSSGNFSLWQIRMKDLLAQQSLLSTLKEKKLTKMEDDD
jgi:hypothetical protein